ncbi:MAG: RAMP superfamily CRISPR-associated protein [Desulfohalobiaceae bacterium]
MHQINIDLEIIFPGKWHSGSGEGGFLTDRLVRLDSRKKPYVPASTLRGVVREQCERLSRTLGLPDCSNPHSRDAGWHQPWSDLRSPVDQLFGTKCVSSTLFFQDARMDEGLLFPTMTISRTAMYRALGTGRDKHLFQTEYANPAVLHTKIRGWHQELTAMDEKSLPIAYVLLLLALQSVDRLGGDKSTGKGSCELQVKNVVYNQQAWSWEAWAGNIQENLELWDMYMEEGEGI